METLKKFEIRNSNFEIIGAKRIPYLDFSLSSLARSTREFPVSKFEIRISNFAP